MHFTPSFRHSLKTSTRLLSLVTNECLKKNPCHFCLSFKCEIKIRNRQISAGRIKVMATSPAHFGLFFSIFGNSPETLVPIFFTSFLLYTSCFSQSNLSHLFSASLSCSASTPSPQSSCWWYLVLGRGYSGSAGICSKAWRLASHQESQQQPESCCWIYLQPTCQLMLFVDLRRVAATFLALALSRWSNKWFKNGTRESIIGH